MSPFQSNQLALSSLTFMRNNKSKLGGGFAFYINDQSPRRIMKIEKLSDIEILNIETAIRKNKVLRYANHQILVKAILLLVLKLLKVSYLDIKIISYGRYFCIFSPLNTDPPCFKNSKNPSSIVILCHSI